MVELRLVILDFLMKLNDFLKREKITRTYYFDRLLAVKQHAEWSAEWKGERLGLIEMRQHYSNYFVEFHILKNSNQVFTGFKFGRILSITGRNGSVL